MYYDLTKGKISKNLILFALPMMAGNLMQQFYNIADTLIVGRVVGKNALAAVEKFLRQEINAFFFQKKKCLEQENTVQKMKKMQRSSISIFQTLQHQRKADTGQFFRALSTDYVRLYPGTQQMLASLKKWTKKYICYRMPSAFLPHMK